MPDWTRAAAEEIVRKHCSISTWSMEQARIQSIAAIIERHAVQSVLADSLLKPVLKKTLDILEAEKGISLTSVVTWTRYENDPSAVPLRTLLLVEYRDEGKKTLECIRSYNSLVDVQGDMVTAGTYETYFAPYPEVPQPPEDKT